MSKYPTITVQSAGGDIVVTHAAFETAVQRYAHLTLGNLRDRVNERADTEYRDRSWAECIASLADFDFNIDEYAGSPFCTYSQVDPPRYGLYTDEGNALAHTLVNLVRINRPFTNDQVWREVDALQTALETQGHAEASDTAVREILADALQAAS